MMKRAEKEQEKAIPQKSPFPTRGAGYDIREFQGTSAPVPEKKDWSGLFKKLIIRTVFILIILAIVAVLVFFFVINKKTTENKEPTKIEQEQQKQELILPKSLFKVNYVSFLNIESLDRTNETLFNSFFDIGNDFGFYRILFKKNENELWNNREVFSALNLFPTEISSLFNKPEAENFMLFIYNNGLNKKPGLVVSFGEENKEQFEKAIETWEKNMENNLSPIILLTQEQKDKYYSNSFKETSFLNKKFRYKTFSKNDFGICYAILDDKLVITTSGEAIRKVISILEKI